jgi:three-Cys-motif partner protein
MSQPYRGNQDVIWDRAPHTGAKHAILRKYLDGYFAIMARGGFPRLWFIDGYAGPGVYKQGEPGSPVIALNSVLALSGLIPETATTFYFAEPNPERNRVLHSEIKALGPLPKNVQTRVSDKPFGEFISRLLDSLDQRRLSMPPTLVMLDPFGWADMPMDLLQRLGRHPKTEFFVSLMTSEIIRHRREHVAESLHGFFGCDGWESATDRQLLDLYVKQLENKVGMTYVRTFALRDSGSHIDYFLVFATRSKKGLEQMKRAMWSMAPMGDFSFSDATNPDQLTMFAEPDWDVLQNSVRARFRNSSTPVEEVEDFVLISTSFLPSHVRKHALVPLEARSRIRVTSGRTKAGTFPQGCRIQFI